ELSSSPASNAAERYVQINVCLESATAEAEPSSRPVRRSNQLKNGITIRLNAARTIPTAECSGSLRPISARTASTLTYAASAKNGLTIKLNAAGNVPSAECSCLLRPVSARTAFTLEYGASAKDDSAVTRKAVFSRGCRSGAANCQATAAAERTSTMESRPKPTSAADDAAPPAMIAMTASMTFQVIVIETTILIRPRRTAILSAVGVAAITA